MEINKINKINDDIYESPYIDHPFWAENNKKQFIRVKRLIFSKIN